MEKEYLVVYAIFAYHRFKSVTVKGSSKKAVIKDFYQTHRRDEYRIKHVDLVKPEDFWRTEEDD